MKLTKIKIIRDFENFDHFEKLKHKFIDQLKLISLIFNLYDI